MTLIIVTMKAPPSLLSFLEPFSNGVWLSTVVAIIIVALMTYVIGTIMALEAVVVESTHSQEGSARTSGSTPTSAS